MSDSARYGIDYLRKHAASSAVKRGKWNREHAEALSAAADELEASSKGATEIRREALNGAADAFTANGQVSTTPLFSRTDVARWLRKLAKGGNA